MFPILQIDGFEKYWRRRRPGSSTDQHYTSDIRIFLRLVMGTAPETITVQIVKEYLSERPTITKEKVFLNRRGSE